MKPPDGTSRLLGSFSEVDDFHEHRDRVVELLLEDGDRSDLRSLSDEVGEGRIADWFRRRADRRLSNRSRAFWSVLLGIDSAPSSGELWPL